MTNYIDKHKLTEKKIWDLTLDEIEYIYKNLHMNNYVYAALKVYHENNPPLNKIIKLNKKMIPECMHTYAEKIIELSPYIGNDNPKIIRTNYTYFAYNLFQTLKDIKDNELINVIEFLANIAYIPVIAEKNDNLNLWYYYTVRKIEKNTIKKIKILKSKANISTVINALIDKNNDIYEIKDKKMSQIFLYIIRAMQIIILMCENNMDKNEIITILGKKYKFNIKKPGQLRYRNTLYLYGGDFFRRINNDRLSFLWYTKDIYHHEFPEMIPISFYLTSMKAIERLILAYSILNDFKKTQLLKSLINKCFMKLFKEISNYSENIINIIKSNPKIDISQMQLPEKKTNKQNRNVIYAGEGSRELFFLSLLYSSFVNKINLNEINYRKYLIF